MSSVASTLVKLVGAGYLVYLGLRTLFRAGRVEKAGADVGWVSPWAACRQRVMTIAGLFIAMGLVWLAA
jgi:threonine/homoserine/homoserine lactone efflux protein